MRSRRNIVHKNALNAMISEPAQLESPKFVDAPGGNKQSLKPSGMVPVFAEKKDFGKVPNYIRKIKKNREDDQKRWEEEQREIMKKREMMRLQDYERDSILQVITNFFRADHYYISAPVWMNFRSKIVFPWHP